MKITTAIKIRDNLLLDGLKEVLKIIDSINQSEDEEDTICFQNSCFVTPIFILPLLVYTEHCKKIISYENLSSYMNTIYFKEGGFQPELLNSDGFDLFLKKFAYKTYLPIINFSANLKDTIERNAILSAVVSMLVKQLRLSSNVISGLQYIIEESVDNIIEHSKSDRGYILCQSYPTKKYLDICIADSGISLLGSYEAAGFDEITNHIEAMQASNKGFSTKNLPDAENRGYGIRTSKNMLVKGLSGNYVMISGNAIHLQSDKDDKYLLLPQRIAWQGTIIALRIPYENVNFNYINYLE